MCSKGPHIPSPRPVGSFATAPAFQLGLFPRRAATPRDWSTSMVITSPKQPIPEPLHDPLAPPAQDPPSKPLHDPAGDPTYEPPRPVTEPTPNPASDPPPEMPGDPVATARL